MLRLDAMTRLGLLAVGAFGSYSLGANNIANVMGVFVPDNPFTDLDFFGLFTLTGVQQLFMLGAVAIAVGVFTYSERVMATVGGGLVKISPVPALVIVLAQSITLFLFASQGLEHFLASRGLPTFPLVPVSSSQAVVGAILGISLFKGAGIRYRVLGEISLGWVSTPLVAGVISFLMLFVVDNVFDQKVNEVENYVLDAAVAGELSRQGIDDSGLKELEGVVFTNSMTLKGRLEKETELSGGEVEKVLDLTHLGHWTVTTEIIAREVDKHWFSTEQVSALRSLEGKSFDHAWQFQQALADVSSQWAYRPKATTNKIWNKELSSKLSVLYRVFRVDE